MNFERVLFESKNKKNVIVEQEDNYALVAPNGTAIFDKNECVLNAVIEAINTFGNAKWSKNNRSGFRFQDRNCSLICTLSQVVRSALSGAPINECRQKIRYADGDPYNLLTDNLIIASTLQIQIINYADKQYIEVSFCSKDGATYFAITDYEDELYQIIKSVSWEYNTHKKCFYCQLKEWKHCCLHHLVWIYFNCGAEPLNWKGAATKFRNSAIASGMAIDHKKSSPKIGRWDNRICNLQSLHTKLNRMKYSYTSNLKNGGFYIPSSDGAIYGKFDDETGIMEIILQSDAPNELGIENLRHFCINGYFRTNETPQVINAASTEGKKILDAIKFEEKLYQEVLNK